MNNMQRWLERYNLELHRAIENTPKAYGLNQDNPTDAAIDSRCHTIFGRMTEAFEKGSYNKDGDAIRATCKHFGISHTYTAINAFMHADAGLPKGKPV